MIAFDNIKKSFGGASVIDGLTLPIRPGKIYTFFGPNGCGKSTLMNLVSGLIVPDSGQVAGRESLAGKVGYVFQDYRRHLLPWLNVRDNILFPLALRSVDALSQSRRLEKILSLVPLPFDLHQPVVTLSGGQAQLVSLLRALIIDPALLILDEPFSALDYATTRNLRQTVMSVARACHLTVLFVSHDLDEALYLGDHAVFLTRRPMRVHDVIDINGPAARDPSWTTQDDFIALKRRALKLIGEAE